MSDHRRDDDDPITRKVKLFADLVNRLGFPILACVWLAWYQNGQGKEMIRVVNELKEVITSLKVSVEQQTKALKRGNLRNDRRDRAGIGDE